MVDVTAPIEIESSTELSNVLLQSGGSGGSLSWDVLLVIGILAVVVLGIGWKLWGGAGAD